MDNARMAICLTTFLAPFIPYLLKVGEGTAEEAGRRLGANAWDKAKEIWIGFRSKIESDPTVLVTAQNLMKAPTRRDAQAAFCSQIRRLLSEDASLFEEISRLMRDQVMQQVLAEGGSQIHGARQVTKGEARIQQEVIARDGSIITEAHQEQW